VRSFSTWAAVVLASIGALPATLESRSIVIDIHRKRPDERVARIGPADERRFRELANRAARWAEAHWEGLRAADPALPDCLYNRNRDNLRPLIAIADAIGDHWSETAPCIAAEIGGQAEDQTKGMIR
jgi:putative DNA primase/helicase